MNDQFYEQLIKKKTSGKDIFIYIVTTVLLLALTFAGFLFLGLLIVPVAVLVIYLVYRFVLSRQKVEYEYSIVNYDLQIDEIFNKEKRKEVIALNLREAEVIGKSDSDAIKRVKTDTTYNLTSGGPLESVLSIIINKNNKKINVMIEPDATMLGHIKDWSGAKFIG